MYVSRLGTILMSSSSSFSPDRSHNLSLSTHDNRSRLNIDGDDPDAANISASWKHFIHWFPPFSRSVRRVHRPGLSISPVDTARNAASIIHPPVMVTRQSLWSRRHAYCQWILPWVSRSSLRRSRRVSISHQPPSTQFSKSRRTTLRWYSTLKSEYPV